MANPWPKKNPIEAFRPMTFACSKWPFLGIGNGKKFSHGTLLVEDQETLDRLSRVDGFGSVIVEIKNRPGVVPSVEESAELAAIEALKQLGPQVHRGAISTKNLSG